MVLPPFQEFLDAHREEVYRFLVVLVGHNHADDCFQETFLSALKSYPRMKNASNLRGWVLTIAHRKAMDSFRSESRRPIAAGELPETASNARESNTELWSAVRSLPDKQRVAVTHRFVNDLPYGDIGRIMGTSEEAARRSVHEGVKKLREAWSG